MENIDPVFSFVIFLIDTARQIKMRMFMQIRYEKDASLMIPLIILFNFLCFQCSTVVEVAEDFVSFTDHLFLYHTLTINGKDNIYTECVLYICISSIAFI